MRNHVPSIFILSTVICERVKQIEVWVVILYQRRSIRNGARVKLNTSALEIDVLVLFVSHRVFQQNSVSTDLKYCNWYFKLNPDTEKATNNRQ